MLGLTANSWGGLGELRYAHDFRAPLTVGIELAPFSVVSSGEGTGHRDPGPPACRLFDHLPGRRAGRRRAAAAVWPQRRVAGVDPAPGASRRVVVHARVRVRGGRQQVHRAPHDRLFGRARPRAGSADGSADAAARGGPGPAVVGLHDDRPAPPHRRRRRRRELVRLGAGSASPASRTAPPATTRRCACGRSALSFGPTISFGLEHRILAMAFGAGTTPPPDSRFGVIHRLADSGA